MNYSSSMYVAPMKNTN